MAVISGNSYIYEICEKNDGHLRNVYRNLQTQVRSITLSLFVQQLKLPKNSPS